MEPFEQTLKTRIYKKRVEIKNQNNMVNVESNYEEELWKMAHQLISALSYMHK